MPADLNDLPVYHTVSVPLTDDANAVSGLFMWSFLFSFDAGAQDWFPYGILTNTPLVVDQGYLIIKDIVEPGGTTEPDPTYVFAGPMNWLSPPIIGQFDFVTANIQKFDFIFASARNDRR